MNFIHFIRLGEFSIDVTYFNITQVIPTINTESDTCGYDAYKNATLSSIALDDFRKIAKGKNNFSTF